jgi:signal transduction histidine kinase
MMLPIDSTDLLSVKAVDTKSRHRILLVEDNPGDVYMASGNLMQTPFSTFEIIHAAQLAEAVTTLTTTRIDAIILDLNLPDSQGLDTLVTIKAAANGVPVIVVSGFVDDRLRAKASASGAEEIFAKNESNSRFFSRSVLYVIERFRAREQHRQLEKLLELNPDAVLVTGAGGVVRYVNQAALDLFSRKREDFVGELLGFSVQDGQPLEITIPRKAGERIGEMRVVPFDWHGEPAYLGAIRDITALKHSQQEALEKSRLADERAQLLRRLLQDITGLGSRLGLAEVATATNPLLDANLSGTPTAETWAKMLTPFESTFRGYVEANRKLSTQNQALVDAHASVESVNRDLEAFNYSVAHDLRGPLHNIAGFTSLLLSRTGDSEADNDSREILQMIQQSARRQEELISDLLELSKVTRAELRRSHVDVSGLARSVVAQLKQMHPERTAQFVIADQLCADVDRNLLQIILINLLGNAQKFTSHRDSGYVEFGLCERDSGNFFFVRDNGAGFNQAYAHRLFGVFQRLHPNDEFEGTGVGLSIVKRIVDRHGGQVWAEGALGAGATFFFSLGTPLHCYAHAH